MPFLRPSEYATAISPRHRVAHLHAGKLDESYDLLRHRPGATNPFRGPGAVRRGLEQLLATPEADSLRAVELVKQHPGKMWVLARDGKTMSPLLDQSHSTWPGTRAVPGVARGLLQNSALEIAWTRVVSDFGTREGRIVAPFFTEGHEGFNVDDEGDQARGALLESGVAQVPVIGREPYAPAS